MKMTNIQPLGDQAALAWFTDEAAALLFATGVRQRSAPWLIDVVQAYSSVAVFFDAKQMNYASTSAVLRQVAADVSLTAAPVVGRKHEIPCCYELALDLQRVVEHTGVSRDEVIRLHSETVYTVYAIGFCPGFPYLGYLPHVLCGAPRLSSPRVRVKAGSVGLTGRQTGIYTEPRPGGWNIIGRTPLELVNVADSYFPLDTGDRVCFKRIDEPEYRRLQGQRL